MVATHLVKKSLLRGISNRILHLLARFSPGATSVRPLLHRLRGVRIHGTIFIGDEVYLENEYPEAIEIQEGAQETRVLDGQDSHSRDIGTALDPLGRSLARS